MSTRGIVVGLGNAALVIGAIEEARNPFLRGIEGSTQPGNYIFCEGRTFHWIGIRLAEDVVLSALRLEKSNVFLIYKPEAGVKPWHLSTVQTGYLVTEGSSFFDLQVAMRAAIRHAAS